MITNAAVFSYRSENHIEISHSSRLIRTAVLVNSSMPYRPYMKRCIFHFQFSKNLLMSLVSLLSTLAF